MSSNIQENIKLVTLSGIVDSEWYKTQYPDVAILGIDPIEHYVKYGFLLKRLPSPSFRLENYQTIKEISEIVGVVENKQSTAKIAKNEKNGVMKENEFRGYFDNLLENELRGWAINQSTPGKPVDIDVYINDLFLMKIQTEHKRGDLIRKGIAGDKAGFKLTFPNASFPNGSVVDLKFSGTKISLQKSKKIYQTALENTNFINSRFIDAYYGKRIKPVTVVVPVYNAYDAVKECLESLTHTLNDEVDVLMIDDCSPDVRIQPLLEYYKNSNGFRYEKNKVNIGYTKTVNKAISLSDGNDIVLLNSDTVTTPRWLNAMIYTAYSRERVATVTALSNNSGAFSVPEIGSFNDIKTGLSANEHARLIIHSTEGGFMPVPTGNGFCFYIRRDFIDSFGDFDEEKYPRGYGEENDLCMRALRNNWHNLICDKAYVYHKRSQSFKDEKVKLMQDGATQLRKDYPEYKKLISRFHDVEFNLMRAQVRVAINGNTIAKPRAIYLISTTTGGTPQTNLDLMRAVDSKYDCFLLRCDANKIYLSNLVDGELKPIEEYSLSISIDVISHSSEEYDSIVAHIFHKYCIEIIHVRHIAWHSLGLAEVAKAMSIPLIYSMHDFYSICPTVTLTNESNEFCGGKCNTMQKDCKIALWDENAIFNLKGNYIHRWREQFEKFSNLCSAIISTDDSAKNQICDIFPSVKSKFHVIPHGRDFQKVIQGVHLNVAPSKIRIVVPVNISKAKGALLIRDIFKSDKSGMFEFHFLGKVAPELNNIGIHHGSYSRGDVVDKIKAIDPHIGVVLSLWPETFCHTLTEMWAAGVPVLGINLGAVGNRISESGAGWLISDKTTYLECKAFIKNIFESLNDYNSKIDLLNKWQEDKIKSNTTAWMAEEYTRIYEKLF